MSAPLFIDSWKRYRSSPGPAHWGTFVAAARPLFVGVANRSQNEFQSRGNGHADDILQECLLQLELKKQLLPDSVPSEPDERILAYFLTLAGNAAFDYWRNRGAQKRGGGKVVEAEGWLEQLAGTTGAELERQVLVGQIQVFFESREKDKTIFWLRHRQGMTAKEISSIPHFQMSAKDVENHLAKLTRELRAWMAPRKKEAAR